jgi:hypothetical protein
MPFSNTPIHAQVRKEEPNDRESSGRKQSVSIGTRLRSTITGRSPAPSISGSRSRIAPGLPEY